MSHSSNRRTYDTKANPPFPQPFGAELELRPLGFWDRIVRKKLTNPKNR